MGEESKGFNVKEVGSFFKKKRKYCFVMDGKTIKFIDQTSSMEKEKDKKTFRQVDMKKDRPSDI